MLIIGLTGGIASGKSTVARLFEQLNVPTIDADLISRKLLAQDHTLLEKIKSHFGESIIKENQLDKIKLREIITKDIKEKKWLEHLLHPRIISQIKNEIAALNSTTPYIIVIIPLLTEVPESRKLVQRILVVDALKQIQIERLMHRDRLNLTQANQFLDIQATRDERLKIADDVILNDKNLEALIQEVNALHQKYLVLSSSINTV